MEKNKCKCLPQWHCENYKPMSIEERANDSWANYEYREGCLYQTTYVDGYIAGATEQKAIDDAETAEVQRQRDEYYDELLKLRRQKVEIVDKAWSILKGLIDESANDGYCEKHIITQEQFREAMEE